MASGHTVPGALERTTRCWEYVWGNSCVDVSAGGNAGCELLFNRLVRRDEWNLRHHAVVLKPIVPWNPDVVGSLGFHFEEGEVVDPPLRVNRSRSLTPTLWLGQQRQLQLPSTPRYKRSLH